ncbi:protein TASOR 2-like isoform X2 [Pristis pectinata]|uniref:protein TASOR 2-like isoform X2 n=1 Tax=Pristis pectinata TaxID=685728 RepID=UPI00223E2B80|nr:protein TASOR 2-like isoform X2 [Pristis pectinata]
MSHPFLSDKLNRDGITSASQEVRSRPSFRNEIFCPISLTSSQFTQEILPILQQAYLDETSVDYFHYSQVTLVNNTRLLHQHNDWLLDMEKKGYTKEELAESFAFLLFETEDQAKAVCQKGLETGSSDMTMLGDPMKGVYLCKYSDFLHPTPWHHGKQGYILVFKIIKGRVKPVIENYTSDFTSPTPGYNCHISTNSEKVSSRISHFQAFELTQYYLYEFEQCDVQHCPRQVYPYAVVAFQYYDYKCITTQSGEIGIDSSKIQAVQYCLWKGKLINKSKEISVALKSNGSALMPVTLPTKLEIEYVIKIDELKIKLPQAVFERKTYVIKEVCLEGLYCSWYELVEYLEEGDTPQLGPLLDELKEKNLAIVKCLQDQGLLILFSESVASSARESSKTTQGAAQAVFIFKSPRISHLKDVGQVIHPRQSSPFSAKISLLLPAVSYAVAKGLRSSGSQKPPCKKLVEDSLIEYFKMAPEVPPNSHQNADGSLPQVACERELSIPENCQGSTVSRLSPYFTDPTNYMLPVSAILKLQANYLKLCQKSSAKVASHSHVSEPMSRKATIPRENKPGQVQRKSPMTRSSHVKNAPPGSGMKMRIMAQKQTKPPNRDLRTNAARTNATSKPVTGKAFSKSASAVRFKGNTLSTRATSRPAAKVEKPGPDCGTSKTAPSSLGRSSRLQPACGNKRALAESAKGNSKGQPAPPEVNAKRMKATRVPLKTGSDRNAKAEKAADDCRKARKVGEEKPGQHRSETGINTEQISRYGVCTWNFVEGKPADNGSASLQPLSLAISPNESRSKKGSEEGSGAPGKGIETNILETDALNILADLAISSAIEALPRYKQKRSISLYLASGTGASNKIGSVQSSRRSNCSLNLPAKGSACLPDTELSVAESHQNGSQEHSESQPVSGSLRYMTDVMPAFPSQETLQVHKSPTQVRKDVARRSLTAPRGSHILVDHSYSRPPRDRETVCLAVANPVLSEKEDVVYQSTSMPVESEKRQSTTFDQQNRTHSEVSSKDEERSYEEGTLVGRVLPFRREDSCRTNIRDPAPDPQKEDDAIGKRAQIPDYTLTDPVQSRLDEACQQSRYVHEEKDTIKVTFKWKGPYLYQWDSKYTNDPLEKSVNRALHGLWDPTIQETMKDVKLILHMWIGLFYTKSSMMLQNAIRQVQECTEAPDTVTAGDLYKESAGVQEPAVNESDSESAASEEHQAPGVITSSVIKRIKMNSNLGAYCDGDAPVCERELAQGSVPPEEEGGESDINETVTDVAAQTSSSDLEEHGKRESSDDVGDARSASETQEQSLDQRSTPLSDERHIAEIIQYHGVPDKTTGCLLEWDSMGTSPSTNRAEIIQQNVQVESEESWSSSVTPSACPILIAEKPRSVANESGQPGIIRQSSVIRELLCTKPQAQQQSPSTDLSSAPAPGSCQKPHGSSESRHHDKGSDYLSNGENRNCKEDLGNIEGMLPTQRDLLLDELEQFNLTDAVSESFASTKDVQSHSETSNVITHDYNRSLDARRPVDVRDRTLGEGITGSHSENCADIQQIRDDIETQHKRTMVERFLGERVNSSGSDLEYPDQLECLPPSYSRRNPIRPIWSQKHLWKQSIQQEEEIESANHHDDFDTDSERFDCSRDLSKETLASHEDFSEGTDSEIHTRARSFLEDEVVPRVSHKASCRPAKRKAIARRKKAHCSSDMDSECGSFRENWGAIGCPLQMRNVEGNYLAHDFEENDAGAEMSDSNVHVPVFIKIPDNSGRHKVLQNFSVTTEVQPKPTRPCMCDRITRTFCNLERKSFHMSAPLLFPESDTSCWSNGSPIQNILDLEFIHFSRNVNRLLTRSCAAPYASIFSMRHGRGTALRRNSVQIGSSEKAAPLTVTLSHQITDQSSERHLCNKTQISQLTNREDYTRNWKCELQHLHKPKSHKRYCKRPWSRHADEQMNRMPKKQWRETGERWSLLVDQQANVVCEERKELQGEKRKRCDSFLSQVTNVSSNLHQSLNEVVKESWKVGYKFYVCETNSDSFLKEVKEFLKKEGHVEISQSDLSMIQLHHSGKVLVVIRNEDIATQLHQIPYLAMLKRMQCVQFAGVDSPRDIEDQTFQELFSSGGFIVSDGTVLDKVTPEHLQQISDLLEKLGSESRWKWMVHFKELKKLKEMAREDSAARRKISLLNQKIEANIVEVLPFHGCDSKFQVKPDYLSCLIKLQVQRISSRFAVLLSGKPENREVFTQNGIIVMDVNNLTKELRTLTTCLQSTLVTENAIQAEDHHSTETQLGSFFGKSTASSNSEMDPNLF